MTFTLRNVLAAIPLTASVALVGQACSGDGEANGLVEGQSALSTEEAAADVDGPDELVLKGRRFIRHDLVSAEQWKMMRDPSNLAPIDEPLDPRELDPSTTTLEAATGAKSDVRDPEAIRKVAIQLMAHAQNEHGYYVQAEPDLELAERILYPDPENFLVERAGVEPPEAPRVGRGIVGVDNRDDAACPGCTPSSWVGFFESSGGGTLIGWNTIYTAGHVLYDNDPAGGVGWKCRNGFPDTNTAPPNTNPCDGPGDSLDPRWRFFNGLMTCGRTSYVTNTWVQGGFLSNGWTLAREDYGVVELTCSPNLGYMGLIIKAYGSLDIHSGYHAGYPGLFPCPTGSIGEEADCPDGLRWQNASFPKTHGTLFWTGNEYYIPGQQEASRSWRGFMDVTKGMSGGPITDNVYHIIGVASNVDGIGGGNVNRFNRLNSTVYNFIVANSSL